MNCRKEASASIWLSVSLHKIALREIKTNIQRIQTLVDYKYPLTIKNENLPITSDEDDSDVISGKGHQ